MLGAPRALLVTRAGAPRRARPRSPALRRTVVALAPVGAAFLFPYVVFLGTDSPVYEFLRRIGIYVFFGATGIAQLIATLAFDRRPAGRTARAVRTSTAGPRDRDARAWPAESRS